MSQEGVPPGGLIPQPGDPVPTPRTPAGEPVRANRRDGPRPPTYQGSGLPLGGGSATRERNWEAMSAKIRERLAELAGDVLEWFAEHDPSSSEDRPRAVVLGTRALCIAEPRIDSTGRPVYVLNRYEFAPGSHKKIPVEYRPGRDDAPAQRVVLRRVRLCRSPQAGSVCRAAKRDSLATFLQQPKSSCKHPSAPRTPYDAANIGTGARRTASTYTSLSSQGAASSRRPSALSRSPSVTLPPMPIGI
jgi:hypothetical protein